MIFIMTKIIANGHHHHHHHHHHHSDHVLEVFKYHHHHNHHFDHVIEVVMDLDVKDWPTYDDHHHDYYDNFH